MARILASVSAAVATVTCVALLAVPTAADVALKVPHPKFH